MELILATHKDNIKKYINIGINNFLVGLNNYSTDFGSLVSIKDIENLKDKYPNINLFVSMNKNLFSEELEEALELYKKLDKIGVHSVLFYDLSFINFKNKNNIKTNLVWNQTHMVTNYKTANFYFDKNVKYGYLSSEITKDEMVHISNNSNMKFLTTLVGYPAISHSNRTLLSNYLTHINKDKEEKDYIITEKETKENYKVRESNVGTTILESKLLNGTKPLFDLKESNISYGVIYDETLDFEVVEKLINIYNEIINNKKYDEKLVKESIELLKSDYTGFFYKKTIFKVK